VVNSFTDTAETGSFSTRSSAARATRRTTAQLA
jgi:hypothetical protein